jgi:hypothetical protein
MKRKSKVVLKIHFIQKRNKYPINIKIFIYLCFVTKTLKR